MTIEIKISDQPNDSEWDKFVAGNSFGQHEQTSGFAKSRSPAYRMFRIQVLDQNKIVGGSQILLWRTLLGNIAEIRQGPVFKEYRSDYVEKYFKALDDEVKKRNLIKVKIFNMGGNDLFEQTFTNLKFVPSDYRNSIGATTLVDLNPTPDELFSRIKKKTRYNIRQAQKRGVTVLKGDRQDIEKFYAIHQQTSELKSFPIFPIDYFYYLWDLFSNENKIHLLLANKDDSTLAAMILIPYGDRLCSLWGSAARVRPDPKAGYLLDWEAILLAKELGYKHYDLCGADPSSDSGASAYKRSFGGNDYLYPDSLERYYGLFPELKRVLANSFWDRDLTRKVIQRCLYRSLPRLPY